MRKRVRIGVSAETVMSFDFGKLIWRLELAHSRCAKVSRAPVDAIVRPPPIETSSHLLKSILSLLGAGLTD